VTRNVRSPTTLIAWRLRPRQSWRGGFDSAHRSHLIREGWRMSVASDGLRTGSCIGRQDSVIWEDTKGADRLRLADGLGDRADGIANVVRTELAVGRGGCLRDTPPRLGVAGPQADHAARCRGVSSLNSCPLGLTAGRASLCAVRVASPSSRPGRPPIWTIRMRSSGCERPRWPAPRTAGDCRRGRAR
jgi:hypothetical protein